MADLRHTPGLWRVWHYDMSAGGPLITDRDGTLAIARAIYRMRSTRLDGFPSEAKANADRIVACVNACDGVDLEVLQKKAVLQLVEELREEQAKVAALLGACQETLRKINFRLWQMGAAPSPQEMDEWRALVEKAIKKGKGY